jgi:hypothetical protein
MNPVKKHQVFGKAVWRLLLFPTLLCATLVALPVRADNGSINIPSGTILPVRLNSTVSSDKAKAGQTITGRIMQDVPLSSGERIREGSKVVGHIVDVVPATNGAQARISLQFDKLISGHQTISITTNLRALTSFVGVREAQTPTTPGAEGDNIAALTTVQVGGDVVYGYGGEVTSEDHSDDVVGKSVVDGVLSQIRAKEGTKCRGPLDGNDSPQALWVFSSDACGVYRMEHVSIAHAGRTDPTGVIVLASDKNNLKITEGAGMLLRVTGNSHTLSASR